MLRIIKVGDFDVEACSGLHCKKTGEVGYIRVKEVNKIQDGVIRFTFQAGEKAVEAAQAERRAVRQVEELLGSKDIVNEVTEIFEKYKSFKSKFEKAELERILALINSGQKIITSYFDDVIGILNKLPKDKDFVIIGKNNGIAINKPENKEILTKYFSKVDEKGNFLFAH